MHSDLTQVETVKKNLNKWIEAEEWVCNFIANYAAIIFNAAYDILGTDAWMAVPYELEKMIGARG